MNGWKHCVTIYRGVNEGIELMCDASRPRIHAKEVENRHVAREPSRARQDGALGAPFAAPSQPVLVEQELPVGTALPRIPPYEETIDRDGRSINVCSAGRRTGGFSRTKTGQARCV
jgi:hypothetical protein